MPTSRDASFTVNINTVAMERLMRGGTIVATGPRHTQPPTIYQDGSDWSFRFYGVPGQRVTDYVKDYDLRFDVQWSGEVYETVIRGLRDSQTRTLDRLYRQDDVDKRSRYASGGLVSPDTVRAEMRGGYVVPRSSLEQIRASTEKIVKTYGRIGQQMAAAVRSMTTSIRNLDPIHVDAWDRLEDEEAHTELRLAFAAHKDGRKLSGHVVCPSVRDQEEFHRSA